MIKLLLLYSMQICLGLAYDYRLALEKSIKFYLSQRSGHLPADNPIPWRYDSGLDHHGDNNENLSGGWYHSGHDLGKFILPNAAATTWLLWSIIDYKAAYVNGGLYEQMLDMVKWSLDFMIKSHTAPRVLYYICYDLEQDTVWNRWENVTWSQPCLQLNQTHSDVAIISEVAASLAAGSIVFKDVNATYSAELLNHSQTLFSWANSSRQSLNDWFVGVLPMNHPNYGADELVWANIWIARATNNPVDLQNAELLYSSFTNITGSLLSYEFYNDKNLPLHILLARMTQKAQYLPYINTRVSNWLNFPKSPKGLRARRIPEINDVKDSSQMSFLLFTIYDSFTDSQVPSRSLLFNEARSQIDYMLGDNGRSFLTDFGLNPPVRPKHKTASCPEIELECTEDYYTVPDPNPFVLQGALISGTANVDFIYDDRFEGMDVSTEGNMGIHCALARLYWVNSTAPINSTNQTNTTENNTNTNTTINDTSTNTTNNETSTNTTNNDTSTNTTSNDTSTNTTNNDTSTNTTNNDTSTNTTNNETSSNTTNNDTSTNTTNNETSSNTTNNETSSNTTNSTNSNTTTNDTTSNTTTNNTNTTTNTTANDTNTTTNTTVNDTNTNTTTNTTANDTNTNTTTNDTYTNTTTNNTTTNTTTNNTTTNTTTNNTNTTTNTTTNNTNSTTDINSSCFDNYPNCGIERKKWNMCDDNWWRTIQCRRTCCECGNVGKQLCSDYETATACSAAKNNNQCGKTTWWGYMCQKTCNNCDLDRCEMKYPSQPPSNSTITCVDVNPNCENERRNWNMCADTWWRTTQCQRTCCVCGSAGKQACSDFKSSAECLWAKQSNQCSATGYWGYVCQKTCNVCSLDRCEATYPSNTTTTTAPPPPPVVCAASPADPLPSNRPLTGAPLCPDLRSDCLANMRNFNICKDNYWLGVCLTTCCAKDCTAKKTCVDYSTNCASILAWNGCNDPYWSYLCQATCNKCNLNPCTSC